MKYLKLFEDRSEDEDVILDLFNSIVVDELYMSKLSRDDMNKYDGTERVYCIERYNKNRTWTEDKQIFRLVFDLSGNAKYLGDIKPLLNNFSERLSSIGFKNKVEGTYHINYVPVPNDKHGRLVPFYKETDDSNTWYGLKATVWL